jgi:thioredoxin 2
MHLVCPACGTTNRIPDERLYDALMADEPAALSDAALPKFIGRTELPVLADFWAEWCRPCKAMAPTFAAVARQMPEVRFVKVDSDAAPAASARYNIRSVPTLILFKGGAELARLSGAVPAAQLTAWIRQNVPKGAL